jgi:hypothetical protein
MSIMANFNLQRKWRSNRRIYWLRKYKLSKACQECGHNKGIGVSLAFAHLNHEEKHSGATYGAGSGISKLYAKIYKDKDKNTQAIKTLFKEIRKCRVLCNNCHTEETARERLWNKQYEISQKRKKDADKG